MHKHKKGFVFQSADSTVAQQNLPLYRSILFYPKVLAAAFPKACLLS